MKSSLRHDDSVDSMTELNSFDSSKGDDQESMYAQGMLSRDIYNIGCY